MEKRIKINIIFPYNVIGGAFRSTYEISNRLTDLGYDILVYFPLIPLMEEKDIFSIEGIKHFVRSMGRNLIRGNSIKWFDINFKTKQIPFIKDQHIRDADIIISNHWPTAFPVFHLNKSKGEKFYFIRDIEQWADYYHLEKKCFQLPMKRLVTTEFIKNFLYKNLNLETTEIIRNGFNFENFSVTNKNYSDDHCKILMLYTDHPMKGIPDGVMCLNKIKKKYPNTEIILFGIQPKPNLDLDFKYHRGPTGETLREVYASSDIFLSSSLQEGWHNPPSEAMAAKCAVVATDVGSVTHTIRHGFNGFKVEPGDVDKMFEYIESLINDKELRVQISEAAHKDIQSLTWEEPIQKLDEIFSRI